MSEDWLIWLEIGSQTTEQIELLITLKHLNSGHHVIRPLFFLVKSFWFFLFEEFIKEASEMLIITIAKASSYFQSFVKCSIFWGKFNTKLWSLILSRTANRKTESSPPPFSFQSNSTSNLLTLYINEVGCLEILGLKECFYSFLLSFHYSGQI